MNQINSRKLKRYTFIAVGFTILTFLIVFVVDGIKDSRRAFSDDLPATYTLTAEDSNVITSQYRDNLKSIVTLNSKVRNPITIMSFGREYEIYKFKINVSQEKPLPEILQSEVKSVTETNLKTYTVVSKAPPYNLKVLSEKVGTVNHILVTLSGDSLQTVVKNDRIISYHLLCKNLSIRYSEEAPIDVFLSGKPIGLGRQNPIAVDLLLLKQQKNVYILMMLPKQNNVLPAGFLYNIVNKAKEQHEYA